MKTEINDFIGVFDNAATDEYCESLVDFFEHMQRIGKVVSRKKKENISFVKKDNSLFFFTGEEDPLIVDQTLFLFCRYIKKYINIKLYLNIY